MKFFFIYLKRPINSLISILPNYIWYTVSIYIKIKQNFLFCKKPNRLTLYLEFKIPKNRKAITHNG